MAGVIPLEFAGGNHLPILAVFGTSWLCGYRAGLLGIAFDAVGSLG